MAPLSTVIEFAVPGRSRPSTPTPGLRSTLHAAALTIGLLTSLPLAASEAGTKSQGQGTGPSAFGFTGPEIFPIDDLISFIRLSDINRDGLNDIVVVNNLRSKINILVNQTGQEPGEVELGRQSGTFRVNLLPPDARFRIESISSEKRITGIAVDDFNGDGLPDLAYYGSPPELVLLHNRGPDGWAPPERRPIRDGLPNPNSLTTGDLNGDGRRDLLLLAEGFTYILLQNDRGSLDEPTKIPYSGDVKSIQALDINGDRLDDLLFVNWENAYPFRFRLQEQPGVIGPEFHFEYLPIRSYWADDLDGDRRTEVMTIAQNSGRAEVSNFSRKPSEPLSGGLNAGQFEVLPLNPAGNAPRGSTWGDISGDELADLIVSEPGEGRVTIYAQEPTGRLAPPRSFPSLSGIHDLKTGDWDGDGRSELFVLSLEERVIGVSKYLESGRLSFPETLNIDGRPLAMTLGRLQSGSDSETLAVLSHNVKNGDRNLVLLNAASEPVHQQTLSDDFKGKPESIQFHDLNQDGRLDLVILIPYEPIKMLIQKAELGFWETDLIPPGGESDQPWMATSDIDGDGTPELLLAKDNFVRAVILETNNPDDPEDGTWRFRVKEQINGASSASKIIGVAPLTDPESGQDYLFLVDETNIAVTLCKQDSAGVWQPDRNLRLPFVGKQMQPIALGGQRPNALAISTPRSVAWMRFSGDVWELVPLDSYETPIDRGHLLDVVSGDLNRDQRKDLVFLEIARHYVDIVTFEKPNELVPANRWQVFEEKTYRARRNQATIPEPREAVIADFTADGLNDLAILVHDRILLYPQQP